MNKILIITAVLASQICFAQQRSVSLTIDDVPNVHLFTADGYSSILLKKLDSLKLPVELGSFEFVFTVFADLVLVIFLMGLAFHVESKVPRS